MGNVLASVADLKKKKCVAVWVGNQEVMAVMTGQGVRVYSGFCPHQGGPLALGAMRGDTLTCPWHGCTFELHQGICTDLGTCRNVSGMKLKPLPFHADASHVYVDLPENAS